MPGLRHAVRLALLVVALAGASQASGCALFEDLDSGPYKAIDAGTQACGSRDGGDGGCIALTCESALDCADGQVCCLSITSATSVGTGCMSPSDCTGANASVILCSTSFECGNTQCIKQQCTFGSLSLPLHACAPIPGCMSN
jgi:hypothetical protein